MFPALVKLRVHPDSNREAVSRRSADAYEIWVSAPAERGLANQAALALLAGALCVGAKRLRIIKGAASPHKIVRVL